MFLRRTLPVISSLILALSATAVAQQPQTIAPQGADKTARPDGMWRKNGRGPRMGDRAGLFGLADQLNLTEDQRQQQNAIIQRHMESTKAQREELNSLRQKRTAGTFSAEDEARAKALHQEIRESMKGIRNELNGILTPEQRTKLEQLETERRTRHEEMRKSGPEKPISNPQ